MVQKSIENRGTASKFDRGGKKNWNKSASLRHFVEFLIAAFAKFGVPPVTEGVKVVDSSVTELDEDVFEDILKDPSTGVLTIKYDTEPVHTVASSSEPSPPSSLDSSDSQDTIILTESPS
ncbi:unnamed protein product [Arctogadus glacialis]